MGDPSDLSYFAPRVGIEPTLQAFREPEPSGSRGLVGGGRLHDRPPMVVGRGYDPRKLTHARPTWSPQRGFPPRGHGASDGIRTHNPDV